VVPTLPTALSCYGPLMIKHWQRRLAQLNLQAEERAQRLAFHVWKTSSEALHSREAAASALGRRVNLNVVRVAVQDWRRLARNTAELRIRNEVLAHGAQTMIARGSKRRVLAAWGDEALAVHKGIPPCVCIPYVNPCC